MISIVKVSWQSGSDTPIDRHINSSGFTSIVELETDHMHTNICSTPLHVHQLSLTFFFGSESVGSAHYRRISTTGLYLCSVSRSSACACRRTMKMMSRLLAFLPIMACKTRCARITRSKTTIAFLLFVLVNCAVQTAWHTVVFLCFSRGRHLVRSAIDAAGVQRGFTLFHGDVLQICSGIPTVRGTTCREVYNGSQTYVSLPSLMSSIQCMEGLSWLENYLVNSRSEEIVYLVLQAWLLLVSILALAEESTPNLIVVLVAQVVNTAWIFCRVFSDTSAQSIYNRVIVNRTCEGFDILSGSWNARTFLVSLAFSIVALFCILFFAFKLAKLYLKGSLSSVGSSADVDRVLMWRRWVRVFHELTMFFALASTAIWYDKRTTYMIAPYSTDKLHSAAFHAVVTIIFPWMWLGMYSISKENRLIFLVYAILSVCLLVISVVWFISTLFVYEFRVWSSFAALTITADVLLVATCVVSVVCRLNFGKGLADFLLVEQALQASGFARDVFRKYKSNPPSWPAVAILKLPRASSLAVTIHTDGSLNFVQSPVSPTWSCSLGCPDQLEKCHPDRLQVEERHKSVILIGRENSRPSDVESISDDDDDDKSFVS